MPPMHALASHEIHQMLGAAFGEVGGSEVVQHYGDWRAEHAALCSTAGVLDLGFRSRLCLLGADRVKFLHGQVTNDVNKLDIGRGCYALLVNAKGRIQSDLHIYRLENELLLDFEPGLTAAVTQRLDQYIIADDVQIVDVAPHYGLLSVQGPGAGEALAKLGLGLDLPAAGEICPASQPERTSPDTPHPASGHPLPSSDEGRGQGEGWLSKQWPELSVKQIKLPEGGDLYVVQQPRLRTTGFDLYVPAAALGMVFDQLVAAAKQAGGCACGWQALETARIEAGVPRFGQDMDETNLAPEAGVTDRAISYSKGCYIGQEVIARIRTYGQVTKELRGLRLADDLPSLPARGDKLFKDGKEVGYITSAVRSPRLNANIAIGYVRKETNAIGSQVQLQTKAGLSPATVVDLPLVRA
jgi:folate-binding protein YgfZ